MKEKKFSAPQAKGYSHGGASYSKRAMRGFVVQSGSPSEDIDANNYTLRQRSRILYQSAPVATAALKRQRTNIVGPGLKLKSTIDRDVLGLTKEEAEEWQRHVQREFSIWADDKRNCDATGVNNFYSMQQLVALAWPMSGDVLALVNRAKPDRWCPYSLRLHIIEADRVRTPQVGGALYGGTVQSNPLLTNLTALKLTNGNYIYDGVEVDPSGAIVAYWVANNYPFQFDGELTKFVRVEAYGRRTGLPNILHVMDAERPEQYRGVPYLAQAIEPLLQLNRYTDAELTAAVVQSFFTAFVTTEAGGNEMPYNEVGNPLEPEVSKDPNEYELGAGTINILEPGEDIKMASSTHPNSGFKEFVLAMCEQVGAALEIPADLLLMSFNSSYSASRAALLEAWKGFRMRREWLANDFCRPVYELWLTEAVASGRVQAPGFLTDPAIRRAYLQCEWIGPSQGQLDPTKEVQAAVTAIDNGLTTREAEAIKLNGSEFISNADKLAVENELLKKATGGSSADESQDEQILLKESQATDSENLPNEEENSDGLEKQEGDEDLNENENQNRPRSWLRALQHRLGWGG